MLVVASIFRDSASYVDRYFAQVDTLREHYDVRLVIAEGDSTDGTFDLLADRVGPKDTLLKADHGGLKFESVNHPVRWAQIAYVCNTVLDRLGMDDDDRLIYVESDLAWQVDTMLHLERDLDLVGAVAAMSIRSGTETFYDIWGHVGMDGKRFQPYPPYHSDLANAKPGHLVPIRSAGSCIAVRGEVVNAGVRFSEDDAIRGFCRTIREHTPLYLDPEAVVFHA